MLLPDLTEPGTHELTLSNVVLRREGCWDLDLTIDFGVAAADGEVVLPELFRPVHAAVCDAVAGSYPLNLERKLEEPMFVRLGGLDEVRGCVLLVRLRAKRGEASLMYRLRLWGGLDAAPRLFELWEKAVDVTTATEQQPLPLRGVQRG